PQKPVISYVNGELVCSETASEYAWFRDNILLFSATGKSFVPTGGGTYKVIIYSSDGCSAESDPYVFNIGLEESFNAVSFNVYPNPAKDILTIELETYTAADASLFIYSTAGQLIYREKLDNE